MKTKIYWTTTITVMLEHDDVITGQRRERVFMVPSCGGYVVEWIKDSWKQVCEGLSSRGTTLFIQDRENLLKAIRREYRVMRRIEKRAMGN